MGAEGFHGRVREGIGCYAPRYGHQASGTEFGGRLSGAEDGVQRFVFSAFLIFVFSVISVFRCLRGRVGVVVSSFWSSFGRVFLVLWSWVDW